MSMEKPSTELDQNIIQRLGRDELNALSRVSKYYRDLAEPFLYKDLTFHADRYYRITLLFLTILGRPDLATLIQSLTLARETSPRTTRAVSDAYHMAFWNKIIAVRDMIESIAKGLDRETVLRWFGRIYAGQSSFDGALAVILCLATNLEHLELEARRDELSITTKLLSWSWERSGTSLETFPSAS